MAPSGQDTSVERQSPFLNCDSLVFGEDGAGMNTADSSPGGTPNVLWGPAGSASVRGEGAGLSGVADRAWRAGGVLNAEARGDVGVPEGAPREGPKLAD